MPSWLPEDNVIQPKDGELRTLEKWCDCLYQRVGSLASQFPEGTQPMPKDDEDRLLKKINKMLGG
jgi:hypothetical protein